jgi:V/A-type H+-transporting ATPase subunit D
VEHVSPTRTELLSLRGQIRLAQQGARLLKGKREALVREFLDEIKTFKADREKMLGSLSDAAQTLIRSLTIDGPEPLAAAGLAAGASIVVQLEEQNIWGTKVVDVSSEFKAREPANREYSSIATSARTDETVLSFEVALEDIIRVAPKLHKLGRLAEEIRKTTRRVNALEQRLLPTLEQQVRYIMGVLDQREREDIFRLKRIKRAKGGE